MNILAVLFASEKLGDVAEEQVRKLTHQRKMRLLREKRGLSLGQYKLANLNLLLDEERVEKLRQMGAYDLINEMIQDGEFLQNGSRPKEER